MGGGHQEAISRQLIRDLEEEILRRTGNASEIAIVLDARGRSLIARTGDVGEVRFTTAELERVTGVIDTLIHNHPSGGGLSIADFEFAHFLQLREVIAFGEHFRYRLARLAAQWPDLDTSKSVLTQLQARITQRLQARVDAGSLSPQDATLRFWHDVWTHFAREANGVHYRRETR